MNITWLMNSFLLALQFLTIIPVSHHFIASDKQLGYSVVFYPIIGLLMGGLLVFLATMLLNIPLAVQSVLILIVWVFLTGGLHLDGLADCADAWVGGFSSQQRSLEIMKDPAAGPVAVVILVLMLLLKWTLINYLLEKNFFAGLLVIPMLGRLSVLIMMQTTHYVREDGLAAKTVSNLPQVPVQIAILLGLISGIYFVGFFSIVLMMAMIFIIRQAANKRLGGATGDVYGATVELTEVSLLLGLLI